MQMLIILCLAFFWKQFSTSTFKTTLYVVIQFCSCCLWHALQKPKSKSNTTERRRAHFKIVERHFLRAVFKVLQGRLMRYQTSTKNAAQNTPTIGSVVARKQSIRAFANVYISSSSLVSF